MSIRPWIFGLVALTGFVAVPFMHARDVTNSATTGFEKFVPTKSDVYVHINVPKLFTSEMVRKAVPMALEKYTDEIVMFAGMAKNFNPQAPDVPEDKLKEAIKKASDPKEVAQAFDKIKGFVTDIVIAGSFEGETPQAVVLFKSEFFKPQMLEMAANLIGMQAQGQVQVQKIKKSGGTIYAIGSPNDEQKAYITVPADGILHVAMTEELAEGSFAAASKPSDALSAIMAKRNSNDFVFVAAVGNEDAEFTSVATNVVLDKDLTAQFAVEFKDAEKAKEHAAEANEHLSKAVERITAMLGDKAGAAAKTQLGKTKAEVDGKKVKASLAIPGSVVEELLKKEKE